MGRIKCFLCVVSQLIIGESFIINSKAVEKSFANTALCPISRETGGSKWLLHGMPPKCYVAGSQGPCEVNQILLPKLQNSNHGECMSSHTIMLKLNSGDEQQDISQKLGTYNRIKRQIITSGDGVNEGGDPSGPGFVGNGIQRIPCPDGKVWSNTQKRCIRTYSCGIC